jgi:uncharacterized cupin superfamily protein
MEDLGPEQAVDPALVLDGSPRFRVKRLHTTPDDLYPSILWDCTGGTFRWFFRGDEFVYILEGRVIVHWEDGTTTALGPGDTALFEKGTTNIWEVPCYVKKLAVQRLRRPSIARRVRRVVRGARRKARAAVRRRLYA